MATQTPEGQQEYNRNRKFVTGDSMTVATGANGVTDVLDVRGFGTVGLLFDSTWTSTTMNIQASTAEDGTFEDLRRYDGTVATYTTFTGDQYLQIDVGGIAFIRVEAVTDQTPTNPNTVIPTWEV